MILAYHFPLVFISSSHGSWQPYCDTQLATGGANHCFVFPYSSCVSEAPYLEPTLTSDALRALWPASQDVFDARQLANVAWAFATLSTGGQGRLRDFLNYFADGLHHALLNTYLEPPQKKNAICRRMQAQQG